MIVNKAMYPVSSTMRTITNMQSQFENLQLQLATGKRYNTLAEMGSDRVHDLNLRTRLNRIEGYQDNILTVENRMSFYTNSLERLDEIEADARSLAVPGAYGTDGINFVNARNQATNLLKETIDVLNTDITGQFIFGGNASDKKPVSSFDEIMEGPNGFKQFVADRLVADGVGATGLIDTVGAGTSLAITESDDPDLGLKIASVAVQSSAIAANTTAADPLGPTGAQHDLSFDAQPAAGDTITIGITYPHDRDTVEYVTFTAVDAGTDPMPKNAFVIGADETATRQNFETAMTTRLETIAKTDLQSSSTYAAADDFFNATGESQHPDAAAWYHGQDSDTPRQSVVANVDENTKANYGVQANESGFVELIKGLAVFAVSDLAPLDETNAARYDSMVAIQRGRLSESNNSTPGSIEGITMELGLAAKTVDTVKERHTQYTAQLETMLADIEAAPKEEIAMMLLTLQTQLTASYQATSMASQLTLVNFL